MLKIRNRTVINDLAPFMFVALIFVPLGLASFLGYFLDEMISSQGMGVVFHLVGTLAVSSASMAVLCGSIYVAVATRQWLSTKPPLSLIGVLMWMGVTIAGVIAYASRKAAAGLEVIETQVAAELPDGSVYAVQAFQAYYLVWALAVAYVAKLYWDHIVSKLLQKKHVPET